MIADHDCMVESSLRWMGKTLKSLYVPLHCILRCKQYQGTICFEAAPLSDCQQQTCSYSDLRKLPIATRGVPSGGEWRQIDGSFAIASLSNVPDAAFDAKLTPHVQLDEGALDVLVVRDSAVSRRGLLNMFLKVETGKHVGIGSLVEVYKAKRAVIFPDGGGTVTLGGETFSSGTRPVCVDVQPRAGRFVF